LCKKRGELETRLKRLTVGQEKKRDNSRNFQQIKKKGKG